MDSGAPNVRTLSDDELSEAINRHLGLWYDRVGDDGVDESRSRLVDLLAEAYRRACTSGYRLP